MNTEQLEGLYGPLYRFGDHKVGETIRFYDLVTKAEHEGVIMWVKGPSTTVRGGRHLPVMYIVDTPDPTTGFPFEVPQSDVVL